CPRPRPFLPFVPSFRAHAPLLHATPDHPNIGNSDSRAETTLYGLSLYETATGESITKRGRQKGSSAKAGGEPRRTGRKGRPGTQVIRQRHCSGGRRARRRRGSRQTAGSPRARRLPSASTSQALCVCRALQTRENTPDREMGETSFPV